MTYDTLEIAKVGKYLDEIPGSVITACKQCGARLLYCAQPAHATTYHGECPVHGVVPVFGFEPFEYTERS